MGRVRNTLSLPLEVKMVPYVLERLIHMNQNKNRFTSGYPEIVPGLFSLPSINPQLIYECLFSILPYLPLCQNVVSPSKLVLYF